MPDPVRGRLARLDDPWGLTWRVANLIRRASLRRGLRFASAFVRGVTYERPIFVVGVPRSGTTMLFYLLRESRELRSLKTEGHDIWRAFHHPRYSGWRSDAVGAGEVRLGERRFVNARFHSYFGPGRFVEKTPENSLRIPYLLDLFPDALFVVAKRNPCDVINSLINGWRQAAGRYRSYYVPEDLSIPGYAHRRRWCFTLVEGWRDLSSSPVHEIAFTQWDLISSALEQHRALVRPDRWTEVHFETFLERPEEEMARLLEAVEIERKPAHDRVLRELLESPVNALSPPGQDKWRRDNPREMAELLPRIAAAAPSRGYMVDPETGEFEIAAATRT